MLGGGKYDGETKAFRWATKAEGVVTMVFGGKKGSGFSVQVRADHIDLIMGLPKLMREMADKIEMDAKGGIPMSAMEPE
jgi:hypothetical protein